MPFQKGHKINNGRKSPRQLLADSFIMDLQRAWKEKNSSIINDVIENHPAKFMEMISKLIPRQVYAEVTHDGIITHEHQSVSEVSSLIEAVLVREEDGDTEDDGEDGPVFFTTLPVQET